ncbi:MAG: hypothetical protein B6244_04590 [Candidatus Cloacimonetes bacterium 4572_55]|nr:MAG: hypothetical protein B6244_04590 [Candidatus Cloacimonetes bacterium 4572_55]
MNLKKLKIYSARDAATCVQQEIANLAQVKDMHFDGKRVFLNCLVPNPSDQKRIEKRIFDLKFSPTTYWENGSLRIYFPLAKRRSDRPAWVINAVLFLITVGTTYINGITMFYDPDKLSVWTSGFLFSIPLLLILGAHEFGHYTLALYHRMKATLPYFIPAPSFPITPIGTFGAFIKMKSPIPSRVALFDVGISGPLAGFFVAIPVVILGLTMSEISPIPNPSSNGIYMIFGDSLLMKALYELFGPTTPEGFDLVMHPLVYAGWIGFLVTSLNLLPIGQLDGGHIMYAMFPRRHRLIARLFFAALLIMGLYYKYWGWFVWAFLILFLIRLDHPPTLNDQIELDSSRKMLGYVAILIFIITFTPVPVAVQ